MYKLHGFSQSGNTYKVALLLQALRQPWEAVHLKFADFAAGIQRTDAFRADLNAMGEVPILEGDGKKLTQSAVILLYLSEKYGAYRGSSEDDRLEVMRWMFFDNHKFTSYLASWRFSKSFMPTAPDPALEKWFKGRIDNACGIVERHLSTREYIVGSQPTIADLSLCGYLYFPTDESGYDIGKSYPSMAKWLERLKQLPGWKPPYEMLPGERIAPRW